MRNLSLPRVGFNNLFLKSAPPATSYLPNGLVSALQDTLDGIVPQAVWETNEKTLNEIYLHTAFIDQSPDSVQTADILQIAEQCLADGGPSVARARAWYFALTGTRVEIECNGIMEREISDSRPNHQARLIVAPNPARDKVSIQIPDMGREGGRLEILDMQGKLQNVIYIDEGTGAVEILTNGWSNGLYFCHLRMGEKTVSTAKFSIQH